MINKVLKKYHFTKIETAPFIREGYRALLDNGYGVSLIKSRIFGKWEVMLMNGHELSYTNDFTKGPICELSVKEVEKLLEKIEDYEYI